MVLLGIFYLSKQGMEVLSSTCLAIPFSSFYISLGKVRLRPVYYVNDVHFLFWLILSYTLFYKGFLISLIPLLMMCLFFLAILKRKTNFIQLF